MHPIQQHWKCQYLHKLWNECWIYRWWSEIWFLGFPKLNMFHERWIAARVYLCCPRWYNPSFLWNQKSESVRNCILRAIHNWLLDCFHKQSSINIPGFYCSFYWPRESHSHGQEWWENCGLQSCSAFLTISMLQTWIFFKGASQIFAALSSSRSLKLWNLQNWFLFAKVYNAMLQWLLVDMKDRSDILETLWTLSTSDNLYRLVGDTDF